MSEFSWTSESPKDEPVSEDVNNDEANESDANDSDANDSDSNESEQRDEEALPPADRESGGEVGAQLTGQPDDGPMTKPDEGGLTVLTQFAGAKDGTLSVDKDDHYIAQELDASRRLPGGVYLDRVERVNAEIRRAEVEQRQPDLENPPPSTGTPVYTAAAVDNPNNQNVAKNMLVAEPFKDSDKYEDGEDVPDSVGAAKAEPDTTKGSI